MIYLAIFSVAEINKIDFDDVLITSSSTLIFSQDKTKTFVTWEGETQPACISQLTTLEDVYTIDYWNSTVRNNTDWAFNY
jgi:hypothetical protein